MSEPTENLVLDRLIHEPGRLAILTVLSSVADADFVFLQRTTGLTKGNLSSHLTKLEAAGLVEIQKRFVRRKPNTNVALTELGRERIARHWEQLERLRTLATSGPADRRPDPGAPDPPARRGPPGPAAVSAR
jgi:DNA-binding MarR family transcriptional regulator